MNRRAGPIRLSCTPAAVSDGGSGTSADRCAGAGRERGVARSRMAGMGELTVAGFVVLALVLAVPAAIFAGFAYYTAKVAKKGPEAVLAGARRRRELA
ncbi:hypothetical protein GCM10027440_05770 [Nocardiopsis coralliicola]